MIGASENLAVMVLIKVHSNNTANSLCFTLTGFAMDWSNASAFNIAN